MDLFNYELLIHLAYVIVLFQVGERIAKFLFDRGSDYLASRSSAAVPVAIANPIPRDALVVQFLKALSDHSFGKDTGVEEPIIEIGIRDGERTLVYKAESKELGYRFLDMHNIEGEIFYGLSDRHNEMILNAIKSQKNG
jgi:arginase family enzyme